jgi:phage terminase large subunit
MRAAVKGRGSIEDGISFLQGLDIVVHPRCVNLARELSSYAWKTDRQTGEVLPVPEDANNHLIDALRYAVERLHRKGRLIEPGQGEPDMRLPRPTDYAPAEHAESWRLV